MKTGVLLAINLLYVNFVSRCLFFYQNAMFIYSICFHYIQKNQFIDFIIQFIDQFIVYSVVYTQIDQIFFKHL